MSDPKEAAIDAAARALYESQRKDCYWMCRWGLVGAGEMRTWIADTAATIAAYEDALWRSIEDAPRDGTTVILAENGDTYAGYFEARPSQGCGDMTIPKAAIKVITVLSDGCAALAQEPRP